MLWTTLNIRGFDQDKIMVEQMAKYIDLRSDFPDEFAVMNNVHPSLVDERLVREKLGDNRTILLRGGTKYGPHDWQSLPAYMSQGADPVSWHSTSISLFHDS